MFVGMIPNEKLRQYGNETKETSTGVQFNPNNAQVSTFIPGFSLRINKVHKVFAPDREVEFTFSLCGWEKLERKIEESI
jgi:hypothetical protein